jgi:hypothetical protein
MYYYNACSARIKCGKVRQAKHGQGEVKKSETRLLLQLPPRKPAKRCAGNKGHMSEGYVYTPFGVRDWKLRKKRKSELKVVCIVSRFVHTSFWRALAKRFLSFSKRSRVTTIITG